jgi:methionyl-tRNA formyltransferase
MKTAPKYVFFGCTCEFESNKTLFQREVAAFAEKENLKIHDWPLAVETGKYDVGVLASFGHLIPDDVIHMFP